MKKPKIEKIFKTIAFFTLLIITILILNYVFYPVNLGLERYVTEHDSYYMSIMSETEDTIDVIVMGDSLSYGMINTMNFWEKEGITSFIAGQAGQTVTEAYFELKHILKKQSPQIILFETGVLNRDFYTELHVLEYQIMYDFLPAAKYHELWKVMLGDKSGLTTPHFKGFELRGAIDGYSGGEYMIPTEDCSVFCSLSEIYMKKIKDLCDDNDIVLIFVSMPSPKNYSYEMHNAIKNMSDELNIEYIDFNLMVDEIKFDWSADMLDNDDHVNIYGTNKTSDYLLKYLIDNYDIRSRAGDGIADRWNKELREFKDAFDLY